MRQADLVLARTTHIGSGHVVLIRYAVQPMLNTALALAPEAAHTLTVGTQQTSTQHKQVEGPLGDRCRGAACTGL